MSDFFCVKTDNLFFLKVTCLKEPSALIVTEISTISEAFTSGLVGVVEHLQHELTQCSKTVQ